MSVALWRLLPLLAAVVVADAGALVGHAATTTAASSIYDYDSSVPTAQGGYGPSLRRTSPRETRSARLHRDFASSRLFKWPGVAAKGGSALAEASASAFRAADDPASIFIKNKHLASAGGNSAKFASTDIAQVQRWVAEGLRSEGAMFLPNQLDGTFRVVADLGRVVGTRGQKRIRAIVTNDGRVINAFPVKTR